MTAGHRDIGPELRKLAQSIVDSIDPAVRAAAARVGAGVGAGKCQQVWCPVCAVAALVTGEQHPMLTVIADHSGALLSLVRSMVDDLDKNSDKNPETSGEPSAAPPPEGPPGGNAAGGPTGNGAPKNRYHSIPVTVEE